MGKSLGTSPRLGYSLALGALIGICSALIFTAGFLFRDIVSGNIPVLAAGGNNDYPLLTEVQAVAALSARRAEAR